LLYDAVFPSLPSLPSSLLLFLPIINIHQHPTSQHHPSATIMLAFVTGGTSVGALYVYYKMRLSSDSSYARATLDEMTNSVAYYAQASSGRSRSIERQNPYQSDTHLEDPVNPIRRLWNAPFYKLHHWMVNVGTIDKKHPSASSSSSSSSLLQLGTSNPHQQTNDINFTTTTNSSSSSNTNKDDRSHQNIIEVVLLEQDSPQQLQHTTSDTASAAAHQ
jgi:hypothetical protein